MRDRLSSQATPFTHTDKGCDAAGRLSGTREVNPATTPATVLARWR